MFSESQNTINASLSLLTNEYQYMAMVGRCKRFLIYTLQAAPCAYMLFINLFKDMLNILFAGNLPEDQLQKNYTSVDYISGIGLSICLLNIFTYAIHYGIINVLDNSLYNLSSNKKYHIVAQVFNAFRFLALAISIIQIPFYLFMTQILNGIGFPASVADVAGTFLRLTYGGIICEIQASLARSLLRSQRQQWAIMVVQTISSLMHIFFLSVFVYMTQLGFYGICYAMIISHTLNVVITYIFVHSLPKIKKESLQFIKRRDFYQLKVSFRPTCSSIIKAISEQWVVDIITVSVSYLGVVNLSLAVIAHQLFIISNLIGSGYGVITQSLAGNSMLRERFKIARMFFKEGLFLASALSLIAGLIIYLVRRPIVSLYTYNQQLIQIQGPIILIASIEAVLDIMQGIINSMLRDFLLKAPVVYKLTCVWMWMLMLPLSIGVGVFIAKKLWVVWTFMLICIVGILISDIIVLAQFNQKCLIRQIKKSQRQRIKFIKENSLRQPLIDKTIDKSNQIKNYDAQQADIDIGIIGQNKQSLKENSLQYYQNIQQSDLANDKFISDEEDINSCFKLKE